MSESILTHEYLKSILHYSIITGQFYWLKSRQNVRVNDVAGSLLPNNYRRIEINDKVYLQHRLAWFYISGQWPAVQIDHINGVRGANYWLNLREATSSQNNHNRGLNSDNTSGYKGVYWVKATQKWKASIKLNYKSKFLGCFYDIEDAYAARLKAEKELYGEFARI